MFGALPIHRFRECRPYRHAAPGSVVLGFRRTQPLEFLSRQGASCTVGVPFNAKVGDSNSLGATTHFPGFLDLF